MEHMEHADRKCGDTCSVCGLVPLAPRVNGTTRLVARSAVMQDLLKRAARFARREAPVAIFGETGTGKEVVARVMHANSRRARSPFVAVNVAALPAELLESELFGHRKGAFTGATAARHGLFAAADSGTLFLDEIGEMPAPLQAKLLRVLEDGGVRPVGANQLVPVDVRVMCATHRDLGRRVADGLFREDLYYRLKVLTLELPPLRERQEDILALAKRFLADEVTEVRTFSEAAAALLQAHCWPGNIRELHNVVKHAAALATQREVMVSDLPPDVRGHARAAVAPMCEHISLAEMERRYIRQVLESCGGSPTEAAAILGIGRSTLWRKIQRWGP